MTATNEAAAFFSNFSGGGGGAPSFKFANLGDTVKGKVVSSRMMDQTHYGTDNPIIDQKTGQPKKQLQIILDTALRNWEGCNPGKDQDGNEEPPSEDTGARAVYVKGWMIKPVSDALLAATDKERNFPVPGDILAIKFSEQTPTNKGNPLKKFMANAKAAPDGFGDFAEAQEEKTAAATKAVDTSDMDLDGDDDGEPPF